MNQLQNEYFLAVARNRSFTRTAQELYVTQPAISRQISSLEAELGFTLFDRTSKKTSLTAAGILFYNYFTRCREAFSATVEQARQANNAQAGVVAVGCPSGWDVSGFFPELIQRFRSSYPNVGLTMESRDFLALIEALKAERLDVVMTIDHAAEKNPALAVQRLTEIPRIILYSARSPQAALASPKPADFRDETFVVVVDDDANRTCALVREYCAQYGFIPKLQIVPTIESMVLWVQNGMGVAVMDGWAREVTNDAFRYITLDSSHEVILVWRKATQNPAVPLLVNELTRLAQFRVSGAS